MTKRLLCIAIFSVIIFCENIIAQGVTTAAISGMVTNAKGEALPGVTVMAVHEPTGTRYGITTREDGKYNLPNLKVGGPYTVTASIVGYAKKEKKDIYLQLSQTERQDFVLSEENVQMEVTEITAERNTILNSSRTGAATSVNKNSIESLPTITRRIQDFSRLTPQASGSSFVGQDNRYNNTTVDGSYFNNSFGLGGQPGDRTGVAPISIEAIEQIQVNIAPYDVRQGNFVGAAVNSTTKSGTNEISGAAYYIFRNEKLVGTKAGDLTYNPGTFRYNQIGVRLGGPIIQDELFFFTSFENDALVQLGTTFLANTGGQTVGGNITRVLETDLTTLSSFLKTNFGYETGPYQGYDHEIPALRLLAKLDYNMDDENKFTLRYVHLNSITDVLASNSNSLGFGNRQSRTDALNFRNSNYQITENIRSVVGEWNTIIGNTMSNNLIVGYSYSDESRKSRGEFFPFVDILSSGTTYTSFGFEPFTPNNELRYSSIQLQDNFTYSLDNHFLTFGISAERYQSENVFFPGSQSVYSYSSLNDFYTDANNYLANPTVDTSTITLRRFQVRWSNIPGQEKPIQPLKVIYAGAYLQDEFQATEDIRLSLGFRVDVPYFEQTGYRNTEAESFTFRDETGKDVKYRTDKLPDPNLLFSPRFGFNWDVMGDRTVQLRGGTGIFTGKPAYVWISNQIGNNGILTGFAQLDNTKSRPFNPDPNHYKPTSVSGTPASSYELALTDKNFKFPQLWRSNIAVDHQLPYGVVATAEFLYNKDVNGVYYINANLDAPNANFVGVDSRPRWTTSDTSKIINKITNAIVMKNQNVGYSWSASFSLEKSFAEGWFAKTAYNYGVSKNTVDPGSIASGSYYGNQHSGDPNNPGVGYSANSPGHRFFVTASYRGEYLDMGATTVSVFFEGRTIGNGSYVYAGDLNGDLGTANDLIYIPKDASEMNFQQYTYNNNTPNDATDDIVFTPEQQQEAWEAYIKQDEYLNANRGKYAERGAVFMPMVYRADLSLIQEVFTDLLGKRNSLQIRADFLNVTNLLNSNWGTGQRFVSTQPLTSPSADANGKVRYRLRNINDKLISKTFEPTAGIDDVFRIQLSVKYTFN